MLQEEEMFLTDASVVDHPNLVNLIGYCCEEQVRAVVYDLDPLDTLHNMMLKGTIDLCSGVELSRVVCCTCEVYRHSFYSGQNFVGCFRG